MEIRNRTWVNWSGSVTAQPDTIAYPTSEKELINLVNNARKDNSKVKVIGSGHSCSPIGVTNSGTFVVLNRYNAILDFDSEQNTITVEAGCSLQKIADYLERNDRALANTGTIVDQTISGAMSTGTHGSGIRLGSIDQQIIAFTLVTADGRIREFKRSDSDSYFQAAVVSMGTLGIISTVTLQCVSNYNLEVRAEGISFDTMLTKLPLAQQEENLRFWWVPHTDKVQFWSAKKTNQPVQQQDGFISWFNNMLIGNHLHEFGLWLTSFFPQSIPWLNQLMYSLSFDKKIHHTGKYLDVLTLPIKVKQYVMEYAIPIEDTATVLKEIKHTLGREELYVHMPIEVRFAPKNENWLSMAYGRDTCYIGIITYKPYGKEIPHTEYFHKIHQVFAKYEGRPHWAKVNFYRDQDFARLYPRWEEFKKLKEQLDPQHMFTNAYMANLMNFSAYHPVQP